MDADRGPCGGGRRRADRAAAVGKVARLRFLAQLDTALDGSIGVAAEAADTLGATVALAGETVIDVTVILEGTARTTTDLPRALADADPGRRGHRPHPVGTQHRPLRPRLRPRGELRRLAPSDPARVRRSARLGSRPGLATWADRRGRTVSAARDRLVVAAPRVRANVPRRARRRIGRAGGRSDRPWGLTSAVIAKMCGSTSERSP